MDPTAAQRVANKRRTAAFSKFKSKVAGLVRLDWVEVLQQIS
jgi:hypothetical protein